MTIMSAKVVETTEEDLESGSDENSEEVDASDEGSDVEGSDNDNFALTNAGWADSIAKILKTNKPKGKKTLVLSKAKKLSDVKSTKSKPAGFQVATDEGEVKEEKIEVAEETPQEVESSRKRKREIPSLRIKPNVLEKDRERTLAKIATKGVVQLFNAVKMQQQDISKKLKEAGPLEVRKEKVLKSIDKRTFLDVLMGEKSENVEETMLAKNTKSKTKVEKTSEGTWSVLRDDFMMGAKMKDWDKEVEEEVEAEIDQEDVNMESE